MSKSAKSTDGRKAESTGQLWLRLPGLVREALYETVIGAGLACVDEGLEAERVGRCGGRYAHRVDREAARAGHVASSLVLGGRRVAGRNGVRAIRCSSARSSRWCWEYRPGATRARSNHCRKQSRRGALARAR